MAAGTGRIGRAGRFWIIGLGSLLALLLVLLVGIAAFPVGLLRSLIESRLSDRLGASVSIGGVSRAEALSFSPHLVITDLAIAQPRWAGPGEMARVRELRVQIPLLPALLGRGVHPRSLWISGGRFDLIRDRDRRANWKGEEKKAGGAAGREAGLSDLVITDSSFRLRDEHRQLRVEGSIAADARGLVINSRGQFHGSPVDLSLTGARIVGIAPDASWPFTLALHSPLLVLDARGTMHGALNMDDMRLGLHARAPSLSYLDAIIEAGLFGTNPIDLTADVRHAKPAWIIDRLTGRIGRSLLVAHATIDKGERTKIDSDVHFSQFDFNDLSSAEGRAKNHAIKAETGPRMLPDTRINLSKIGPTDGVVRFRADRLLFDGGSVFRSLSGTLTLDHRDLRIDNVVAGMVTGRMTGTIRDDHRSGRPKLTADLRFHDGRLERVVGQPDKLSGPLTGRVLLTGQGDTIREALGHADGHAGMVAHDGRVLKIAAEILGQDLGHTIKAALGDRTALVPLRCLVVDFNARGGLLTARDFRVDTGVSVGRGQGSIDLRDERIAMILTGASREGGGLRIVDPIRVGGTMSAPVLTIASLPTDQKPGTGDLLKIVSRSIGAALGLGGKSKVAPPPAPPPVDCSAAGARALR